MIYIRILIGAELLYGIGCFSMKSGFTFLLTAWLLVESISAQTPQFRHFTQEDGLPSLTTHQFLIDNQGYGWLATTNGLSRYDGYRFFNFNQKHGLKDDVIAAIEPNGNSGLWVLTNAGDVYLYAGDSLAACPCNPIIRNYKFLSPHALLWAPEEGYLYIAFGALGILKIKPDGSDHHLIRPAHKRDLLAVKVGNRWITEFRNYPDPETENTPEADAGMERHEGGTIHRVAGFTASFPNIMLGGMIQLDESGYLVYQNGAFYQIENQTITATARLGEQVTDYKVGPDGAWWIALPSKQELRRYQDMEALKTGRYQVVCRAACRSFYFDDRGGLWIATLQEGLLYAVDPSILVFDNFGNKHVSALCRGKNGMVTAGMMNGTQIEIDPATFHLSPLPPQEPAGSMVNALAFSTRKSELWGGKRALAYFNGKTWTNLMLPTAPNAEPKPCRAASSIRLSPDHNRIWACSRQLFVCIDALTHDFLFISTKANLKETYEDILEDMNGRVWVANSKNVFQLIDARLEPQRLHPALEGGVSSLYERTNGTMVFATKTGLVLWNTFSRRFELLTEQDGLPENQIGTIAEAADILWVGSFSGAASIRLDESGRWQIRRYTTFDGLPANQITSILPIDDKIWIGTSKGIVILNPEQTNPLPAVKTPVFTGFKINQQWQPLSVFLNKPSYRFDENNMRLEFVNLDFATGKQTSYRYRVQPYQPWQITETPELNLFSMAPGDYRIEVAAADGQGNWSEPARFDFQIRLPFWQTWWFRTLLFLAVAVPLSLFFRYRLTTLRKQSELREQQIELEKQALRAQMDPHFIFNSLNSVQEFILKNDRLAAASYLSRFAKLIRQVLDQSFQKLISLESEIEYLDNYLSLECTRFKGAFNYEISVDPALETALIQLPPMLVQPFVENAVIHGMRGKAGDGLIELSFKKMDSNQLVITVKDNGTGLAESSDAPKKTSYGSSLVKRRLELLSKESNADVVIETAPEGGTQVRISFSIAA
ncbi:MAG: histidine kinase [Saprospiraceae bacterium]|nr:histidine kinase [Saprospiraceae bacterium]